MRKSNFVIASTVILAGALSPFLVLADTPPTSGELFDATKVEATAVKADTGTAASIVDAAGAKVLEVTYPGGGGYPSIDLPVPASGWDLSAFAGVQLDITNTGESKARVALRVDNAGDWKKNPWNTEAVNVAPGETKTVKVTFGKSYGGNPGFALNSSKISNFKVFLDNPKGEVKLQIKNLKPFGTATAAAPAAGAVTTAPAAVPAGPTSPNKPAADGVLFATGQKIDLDGAKAEGTTPSIDGGALKVAFEAGNGYPSLDLPLPSGGWNLSSFGGVQVEVANTGTGKVLTALRVDNAGDWKKNPWNTEQTVIGPGETKTVTVNFGTSYGHPGYALNAGQITNLKVFLAQPKQTGAIVIKSVKAVGTAQAAATTAATVTPVAQSTGAVNTNAPAIDGDLLKLSANTDVSGYKSIQTTATPVTQDGAPALKIDFTPGENAYPNLQFPIPKGGWNLSAFGGIQAELVNPGDKSINVFLRADNAGDWKQSPWNTESLRIPAGGSATVKLTFGKQNGAPAYPLDPNRVSAIQIFLAQPKQPATLILKSLRGGGSPAERGDGGLSKPEDRLKPVVVPAWSGKRPPVDGDWVQTLNENFDGKSINDKLWSDKTWWNGLLNGQTQRYSKDNLVLTDGVLKFKTEKRTGPQYDDPKLPSRDYTTGHLVTYDKWSQAYGYFEARIKLPTARGLWPAFWLMPDRGIDAGPEGWKRESTKNGGMEMDILEHLTEWGPGRNNVAVHWDGYETDHKQWGTTNVYYGPTEDGWHTWGLLWEPGKLTWFIDGIKKAEYENERVGTIPAYIILNVQMGSWATKDVDVAALPDYMQVDWVRAWQLKGRMGTRIAGTK